MTHHSSDRESLGVFARLVAFASSPATRRSRVRIELVDGLLQGLAVPLKNWVQAKEVPARMAEVAADFDTPWVGRALETPGSHGWRPITVSAYTVRGYAAVMTARSGAAGNPTVTQGHASSAGV